jgi:hypothetical protein
VYALSVIRNGVPCCARARPVCGLCVNENATCLIAVVSQEPLHCIVERSPYSSSPHGGWPGSAKVTGETLLCRQWRRGMSCEFVCVRQATTWFVSVVYCVSARIWLKDKRRSRAHEVQWCTLLHILYPSTRPPVQDDCKKIKSLPSPTATCSPVECAKQTNGRL